MQALFKMIKHKVPVATIFNVQSNNPYINTIAIKHIIMPNSAGFSFLVCEVKISLFSTNVYAKALLFQQLHTTKWNQYKYYEHEVPYDHVLMDKTSDMSADPIQRMDTLKYT